MTYKLEAPKEAGETGQEVEQVILLIRHTTKLERFISFLVNY